MYSFLSLSPALKREAAWRWFVAPLSPPGRVEERVLVCVVVVVVRLLSLRATPSLSPAPSGPAECLSIHPPGSHYTRLV
ncbi:hypothetical protein E2C01_073685 [Portunus trituberculatus]|uniref:Uncharacterized protein n=1 Tax=Portunus trituberculatus TaxID=210409 RepID=A0A5B7I604_PORTR|nr:hypothetical protein [Portunus trituberculatus]